MKIFVTAVLVADSRKLRSTMDWKPLYDDIEYIIKTAWDWEKSK
jgi:UDP-glucose 4-epimerase